MERRLTIAGWFHTLHSSSGNIAVTSMLSESPQSKPSSTSTNMCTKAMIAPLWNLGHVRIQYLNTRYVSACEALWRIYHFHRHEEHPNVIHLQIHLPNQQIICWDEHVAPDLEQVAVQAAEKDTTLTAYFKANELFPEARNYLYQDFPMHFVWINKGNRKWKIGATGGHWSNVLCSSCEPGCLCFALG